MNIVFPKCTLTLWDSLIAASLLLIGLGCTAPASWANETPTPIQSAQTLPEQSTIQVTERNGERILSTSETLSPHLTAGSDYHYHYLLPAPFISDVSVQLWEDHDANGFYSRFQLTFDVASDHYHHAVFAQIYLKTEGDIYRLFHTTAAFPVRAWPLTDYYEMDARLLSHYGRDWYDIRIELYDQSTGTLYDTLDAFTHHGLFNIPLEATGGSYYSGVDVVIHATAGAFDSKLAAILLFLAAWRWQRTEYKRAAQCR